MTIAPKVLPAGETGHHKAVSATYPSSGESRPSLIPSGA